MDSNGYNPSIMPGDSEEQCFLCGVGGDLARHEVFFGTANRKLSKKYGLWVHLCPLCHGNVHNDRELDLSLKKIGETAFNTKYGFPEFMRIFGRNYL